MSKTNHHISDFKKFDTFKDYSDEEWLIVQMLIDENAQKRKAAEREAERNFQITLISLGLFGLISLALFIGVSAASYLAVSSFKNQIESK